MLGAPFSLTRINTRTDECERLISRTLCRALSNAGFISAVCTLFSEHDVLGQCSCPQFSARDSPTVFAEHPGGISQGLVARGRVRGCPGNSFATFAFPESSPSASPENPIRAVSSNTLANIGSRVPIPGIRPDSLIEMESAGNSWYNGLEVSLTKRLSHGLQFLASYTFSKTLDTDGADINSTSGAVAITLGDQNSPRQRWGRASSDRTHRFIFSETWQLPSPSAGFQRVLLGGWDLAGVLTIQSGSALTISDTNANNVFGISEDRAQLSGTCVSKNQLVNRGSVESKLGGYFNSTCFTNPPIIGADGIGTAFGDSATGIVDGPGQANLDLALSKTVALNRPIEKSTLQFRAEFYNALNHPQFANPDSNFTSPTFGVISSTSVNARVGQLALRFGF